jgi:aminoglycoside 3-N-acetyltransferase
MAFHETLSELKIRNGDILYVASNIIRILRIIKSNEGKFDPNLIIDILQNAVGNEGTLLFPVFNWDFCNGLPFDYYKTPSMTGSLSKIALQRKDFKRTKHPIYSFAVWGKYQDLLYSLDNKDSFGENSPFNFFLEKNGKYLQIGSNANDGFTFFHYFEQMTGVPYRYIKYFTAPYVDENGACSKRTYSMCVRNLELETKTDTRPMIEYLEKLGMIKTRKIKDVPLNLIDDMKCVFNMTKDEIINNCSKRLVIYKGQ